MDIIGLILIVVWIYGIYRSWMDLSSGSGMFSRGKKSFLSWINKRNIASIIVKVVLVVVAGLIYVVYAVAMAFLKLMNIIFHL